MPLAAFVTLTVSYSLLYMVLKCIWTMNPHLNCSAHLKCSSLFFCHIWSLNVFESGGFSGCVKSVLLKFTKVSYQRNHRWRITLTINIDHKPHTILTVFIFNICFSISNHQLYVWKMLCLFVKCVCASFFTINETDQMCRFKVWLFLGCYHLFIHSASVFKRWTSRKKSICEKKKT